MPFLVGKYRAQAKAFTRKELRGIVEAGVQTEEDVKTGKMGDILSVELFWCSTVANGKSNQI